MYPSSKTLIQPQMSPPLHSDEIAKPLMGQFMGNNSRNLAAEN